MMMTSDNGAERWIAERLARGRSFPQQSLEIVRLDTHLAKHTALRSVVILYLLPSQS